MQSLGHAHAIEPVLRDSFPDDGERATQLSRRMEFFNTNPFLASAVLGSSAHYELEDDHEAATEAVQLLMGPFGGIGDSFYWGSLKPLLILVAMAAVLEGYWAAPFVFAFTFCLIGMASRLYFFNLGLKNGKRVVVSVQHAGLLLWSKRLKVVGAFILGWVAFRMCSTGVLAAWQVPQLLTAAVVLPSILLLGQVIKRELDPIWLVEASALTCILLAAI